MILSIVTKTDDCKSIATNYGITEEQIEEWNQDFNPQFQCNDLKEGDRVCVQVNL